MNHRERALRSLDGLSIGDAFGQRVGSEGGACIDSRTLPTSPWPWTDDTHMALSVVEELFASEELDADRLMKRFLSRYVQEPHRGYGRGAHRLLTLVDDGGDWRKEVRALFDGQGSYGNGAAMRVAPIGAYFARHPARAADEARTSASPTHAHSEGVAGAIAVAAATAIWFGGDHPRGNGFLEEVLRFVPSGETHDRIEAATAIGPLEGRRAVETLGSGQQAAAFDTVPFCLWVVAHFGEEFAPALWLTVAADGDTDTTCAIIGGILGGAGVAIPSAWRERREPLPEHLSLKTTR